MIEFSEEIGFWSKFTFWYVFINAIVTAGFLVIVVIGGLFDMKYLFKCLREEEVDEMDDGRVVESGACNAGAFDVVEHAPDKEAD